MTSCITLAVATASLLLLIPQSHAGEIVARSFTQSDGSVHRGYVYQGGRTTTRSRSTVRSRRNTYFTPGQTLYRNAPVPVYTRRSTPYHGYVRCPNSSVVRHVGIDVVTPSVRVRVSR